MARPLLFIVWVREKELLYYTKVEDKNSDLTPINTGDLTILMMFCTKLHQIHTTSCKYGHMDCIHDPLYSKENYPEWFNTRFPDGNYEHECDSCIDSSDYDDEDK